MSYGIGILAPAQTVQADGRVIWDYVKTLADDSMQGRQTGLPSLEKAAAFIADRFKEWGIEPAGDNSTYFQRFPLKDFWKAEPGATFEITSQGRTRAYRNQPRNFDWRISTFSGSGNIRGEIVFVGFGIHAPDKGYDDYAGLDIKGKIVLLAPFGAPRKPGLYQSPEERVAAAQNLGAKAVICCPRPAERGKAGSFPTGYYGDKSVYKPDFVIIGINERVLTGIFDILPLDADYAFGEIEKTGKPQSIATGVEAAINVRTIFDPEATGVNVVGKISGSDRKLKAESVLLGAHMDGLGMAEEGDVLNGANDNATGTATVMETARLMKSNGIKPKRTVIFALWSGEEMGLLGSDYYSKHPLFPLDKTVANLNLDMVGQGGGKLSFGGTFHGPEVWAFLKKTLPAGIMNDVIPGPSGGSSDQISFVNKGVPGFMLIGNRPHFWTHHPHDDIELVKPELLAKACTFLYQATMALAQTQEGLIPADRKEQLAFKTNTIINCHGLTLKEILASAGKDPFTDKDAQLLFLEDGGNKGSAERKLDALKQIQDIKKTHKDKPFVCLLEDDPVQSLMQGSIDGTWLILGIKGSRIFRDDPDFLSTLTVQGVKLLSLGADDLLDSNGELGEEGKTILKAAEKAGVTVILDEPDEKLLKSVLAAGQKPLIVLGGKMPSSEGIEAMKAHRAGFGLKFPASARIDDYAAVLKTVVETFGPGRAMIWNVDDLWQESAKAAQVRLIAKLLAEPWANPPQEASQFMMFEPKGLMGLLNGAFLSILSENGARGGGFGSDSQSERMIL